MAYWYKNGCTGAGDTGLSRVCSQFYFQFLFFYDKLRLGLGLGSVLIARFKVYFTVAKINIS